MAIGDIKEYRQDTGLSLAVEELISLVRSKLTEAKQGLCEEGENVTTGLTIDLSHQHIGQIPLEVIEIIKYDVER